MKKNYFIFMSGITVGLILTNIIGTVNWVSIVVFFIIITVFSFEKLYVKIMFMCLLSFVIVEPISWMYGMFKWYSPLIELWILTTLIVQTFNTDTLKKPIFVDCGDVTRFPVKDERIVTDEEVDKLVLLTY